MSSGPDRVDVSVESKRAPEPPPDKSHPNTCPGCGSHYRDDELAQSLRVCPQCGHHFPVRAGERIEQLADPGSFVEEDEELRLGDAIVCGRAEIDGEECRLAVMDFAFMGGSMGSVVGEKFARACD